MAKSSRLTEDNFFMMPVQHLVFLLKVTRVFGAIAVALLLCAAFVAPDGETPIMRITHGELIAQLSWLAGFIFMVGVFSVSHYLLTSEQGTGCTDSS